jgi:integrase
MNLKRDGRSSAEKQRDRVLNDDEIRALWSACDQLGNPGALVRLLLLTGQRLRKVANMKWDDVTDGVWTISTESREKGNAGEVRLPQVAVDLIAEQPRIDGNEYIFPAARGSGPINSFAQLKRYFDRLMPADMPDWRFHDLRRTARTRMAELEIDDRIAELTLGHKIKGVEAVYNRAKLTERKSAALQKLTEHIVRLLNAPEPSNIVSFRQGHAPVRGAAVRQPLTGTGH